MVAYVTHNKQKIVEKWKKDNVFHVIQDITGVMANAKKVINNNR